MSRNNQKAFTLVELMLAMAFVSVLLMAIAMLTIQISSIYTKGITLRDVNQAGRSISEDLHRNINASAAFDSDPASDPDKRSYVVQRQTSAGPVVGGRLCLGDYSYVWNTGTAINGVTNPLTGEVNVTTLPNYFVRSAAPSTAVNPEIRLVKVADKGKTLCIVTNQADVDTGAEPVYKPVGLDQTATELLTAGDRDLAIHSFEFKSGTITEPLYAISIVIGTNHEGQISGVGSDQCKPPSELDGEEAYCSVNRFDIIARTSN